MTSAMRRAARHNQDGFALAAKGAWYSARAEFHSALELEVAGADSLEGASARSRALREARIALQEASDFAPRSGTGSRRLDVAHLVAGHQSQVIDAESSAGWSAAAAHEAYLAFAKRRFADAGAGRQAASVALHGLGKVHAALGGDDGEHSVDHRKKARAYYEAALEVGPDNFIAANDLAVLLADEGDLERGRATLEAGLRISRQPAMLDNLAGIYRRMGQPQAADQLRAEAAGLKRYAAAGAGDVLPTHDVRFLNPEQFAATARGGDDAGRTPVYSQPAIAQAATAGPYAVQPQAGPQRVVAGPTPGPTPAPAPVRAPVTAGRPIRNALVY
jgi:tetratricopeptide (TPR) repeat protein